MPRTLAFGDIHGTLAQLDTLLSALNPTAKDHLVFLGDYIDRGPDSAGVLSRLIQLSKSHRTTTLMGNHEEMMLAARSDHTALVEWLFNGGEATLHSYGGTRGKFRDVPANHWAFLENNLVPYLETDTHIFVHASAHPHVDMPDQADYMLRWERCDEIKPHQSGKIIVCGHTPQTNGKPMNRGYAICIDTHACSKHGVLTCLDTSTGKILQADAHRQLTRAHITDFQDA